MSEKIVPTELGVKATASLQEEVEKELKEQDPDKEKAMSALGLKDNN